MSERDETRVSASRRGCMRARRVTIKLRRRHGEPSAYVTDVVVPAAWKRAAFLQYVRREHPEETVRIVEWHDTGGWLAAAWLPNPSAFSDFRRGVLYEEARRVAA